MYCTRRGTERAFFMALCLLLGFSCLHLGPPHVNHQFKSYTSALTRFLVMSSTIPDLTGSIFLFLVVTQAHIF